MKRGDGQKEKDSADAREESERRRNRGEQGYGKHDPDRGVSVGEPLEKVKPRTTREFSSGCKGNNSMVGEPNIDIANEQSLVGEDNEAEKNAEDRDRQREIGRASCREGV